MSWIREHTSWVLEGLWKRKSSAPFHFDHSKPIKAAVTDWLWMFDKKFPYAREKQQAYWCTPVKEGLSLHKCFVDILSGDGPGDDDTVEIPLRVGEHIGKMYSFIHNSFLSLWKRLKPGGLLVLPGRDAWAWFVLAKRCGVPALDMSRGETPTEEKGVVFDPRVSRRACSNTHLCRQLLTEWKAVDSSMRLVRDVFAFDTGFNGSIPVALSRMILFMLVLRQSQGASIGMKRSGMWIGLISKLR